MTDKINHHSIQHIVLCRAHLLLSCSVVSDSLQPHGLQHTKLPCPSLSPGVCSNSYPLDVGDAMQPSHPLLPTSPESALHIRWPKYWSFSISPSNEHSGLISFRIDWFDLLAVQGTLKSLLQQHNSKASISQRSVLFIVQLSQPYMATGKTIALTSQRKLL